jgi:hypothetical protein
MPELIYQKSGLVIKRNSAKPTKSQVRALQADLRKLGYLKKGIDGKFRKGAELAIKALQYDLMHNDGSSRGGDGKAPVRVLDYNRGRIVDITGECDEKLARCISDMLSDSKFLKLPRSLNPREENKKIAAKIRSMSSIAVPVPFLMAVLKQESGMKHFNEPGKNDDDTYITVGLDTNASKKYIITSRGYGAGQYTLFHHPPRREELKGFILDVEKNLEKAISELRYKFDNFVNGKTSGTRADDRIAEFGKGKLRLCRYGSGDLRYMSDCKTCMIDAGQREIREGVTSFYKGSKDKFIPTHYYQSASYESVPVRGKIGCDWPYAVRRYNGSGINSYHYQARILRNIFLSKPS